MFIIIKSSVDILADAGSQGISEVRWKAHLLERLLVLIQSLSFQHLFSIYLGFLSQTFMIHGTAGKEGGYTENAWFFK